MAQQGGDGVADVRLILQGAANLPPGDGPGQVFEGVVQQLPLMFFPKLDLLVKPAHPRFLLS